MHAWTQIIASLVGFTCASSLSVHALPISDPAGVVPLVNTEVIDNAVVKAAGALPLTDIAMANILKLASRDIALVESKVIGASAAEEATSADDLPATPLNDRRDFEDEENALSISLSVVERDLVLTDPHLSI
ncbi:hypothetical protein BKA70DRAFT_1223212 [Coprinopsis sp. MPI-PUGE-AT-0042]|nr:hypothetical protein BKA70DRAFT_1223212 [Coprinopsis sp. MPI-PUGE-AT-0042]